MNLTAFIRHHAGSIRRRRYWNARAPELIETYDLPETWPERGWMAAGVEEEIVPPLLRELGIESVIVAGAGSGRQYGYLLPLGLRVEGFDLSARLVRECRRRYSSVRTKRTDVVGAHRHLAPADAVLCSGILQHVPPDEIEAAIASLRRLARRLVVVRELTELAEHSDYQWAHDYEAMFAEWDLQRRFTTDQRPGVRVELLAFVRVRSSP